MKNKDVFFNEDIKPAFKRGIEKLAKAVKITLGPSGKNVAISKGKSKVPLVTKDGVTVANNIRLADELESLGALMIQEVANKANSTAGDGTTTATILAEAIYNKALHAATTGVNPIEIKREIDEVCLQIVSELEKHKKSISSYQDIYHVAKVALNGDGILAELIAKAFERVGITGSLVTETNTEPRSELSFVEGVQLERGILSRVFATSGLKAEYNNPAFYIVYDKIEDYKPLARPIEYCHTNKIPLIISCEDIHDTVLSMLAYNRVQNGLKIVIINNPGSGDNKYDYVEDFATVVGATIFGQGNTPYDKFTPEKLGNCRKIKCGIEDTIIIGGKGDTTYLEQTIQEQINDLQNDQSLAKKMLQDRLNRLKGQIAILKLGNHVDIELNDTKLRVEDAINATKSAMRSGVLPGGGVALLRAKQSIEGKIETIGGRIIMDVLKCPISSILENAAEQTEKVIFNIENNSEYWYGYDAARREYGDMYELGILDPFEVTKSSFLNAAAAASMLVTTDAAIVSSEEKEGK